MALIVFLKPNFDSPKVNEKDVYMEATTLSVNIKDLLSVSEEFGRTIKDDNGGSFGYVDIELINEAKEKRNFELFVTDTTIDNKKISPNYVKLYVTDENNKPLDNFDTNSSPTFSNLNYLKDKPSSKLLLKGSLDAEEHRNIILRTWISDSFVVNNGQYSFSYDLGVRAV